MKIFVTGGLGVIGSSFCKEVMRSGHEVTVLDACEEPRNEWMASQLTVLGAKIRRERMESADLSEVLDHDLVLHAAAFTGIPSSADKPDDDWTSNVDATRNLLNVLRHASKPPKTVVLSSVKPYKLSEQVIHQDNKRHSWAPDVAVDESWPLDPDEPYAASKMAQSAICTAYAKTYDLPLVTFRCSNLYGAAPCHGPRHGWLTWFCIQAALGYRLSVLGTGFQCRDMLYSSDVTSAVLAASIQCPDYSSVKGKLFNLGGGIQNTVSILEAADMLVEQCGASYTFGQGRKFEDLVFVTNHSAFTHATGWKPLMSVEQGMKYIVEWARHNRSDLERIYRGLL